MKFRLITVLCATFTLWSNLGRANLINYANLFKNSVQSTLSPAIPRFHTNAEPVPSKPIRQAQGKVRVVKILYIKKDTQFDVKIEEVCTAPINVNVYDSRGQTDINFDFGDGHIKCPSTLDGQPIEVHALGLLDITNDTSSLLGQAPVDIKMFAAALFLNGPNIDDGRFNFRYFMTKDLSHKSGILPLIPEDGYSCKSSQNSSTECTVAYPESFSAIIDFEDNAQ